MILSYIILAGVAIAVVVCVFVVMRHEARAWRARTTHTRRACDDATRDATHCAHDADSRVRSRYAKEYHHEEWDWDEDTEAIWPHRVDTSNGDAV